MDSPTYALGHSTSPAVQPQLASLARYVPSVLIVVLAIVVHWDGRLAADNSWLLTVGEKWLAGAVPYVDFIETNPPASLLLYMPAIILAHWLGVPSEICVTIMMFAGVLLSLTLTERILRRAELLSSAAAPWWAAACIFLFLFMPGYVFAQREHIAAVLVLPVLATYASAVAARPAAWPAQLAAGLAGGICVAIKPYFGFALLLPLAFALFRLQKDKAAELKLIFSPVNCVIVTLVAVYSACVTLYFPAFARDILPLVLAVYVPVRIPILVVLAWVVKCWLPAPFLLWRVLEPGRSVEVLPAQLILASLGFAIAVFIQGKAWPYHVYPTLTFGILALFGGLVEAVLARRVRLIEPAVLLAMLTCAVMTIYSAYIFSLISYSPLVTAEVRKLGLQNPKILTISSDIALGHPLAREVGAEWVDRLSCHWITVNADAMLTDGRTLSAEQRARIEAYAAFDRASLIKDIVQRRPDLILVEQEWWKRWGETAPDLVAAMKSYQPVSTVDNTILLRRQAL